MITIYWTIGIFKFKTRWLSIRYFWC